MKKSRIVAALLAFFGGAFGLDRFYLGQPQFGFFLVMLTLFTSVGMNFPAAALIGIFHAITLILMSDKQFDSRYNRRYTRQQKRRSSPAGRATQDRIDMQVERHRNNYKKSDKKRANPFIKSAMKKYEEYDLEGALEDFNQAMEIAPANKNMHFSMAGIYSLKEKTDKSLYHLEQAIKLGFKDFEKINTHDDLAFLRIQPEFESFKANGYRHSSVAIEAPKKDLLQDDRLLMQLNKLKDLRDKGLLSEKEFIYEKEKLSRR